MGCHLPNNLGLNESAKIGDDDDDDYHDKLICKKKIFQKIIFY